MGNPIIWWEVNGRDGAALREFYGNAFDWSFDTDNPMNYGVVDTAEGQVGGGVGQTPDGSDGFATFYVGTDNVAAHLDKIAGLGGTMVMPSTTVMEGVTIGLFADPEGHVIGLLETTG